MNKNYNRGSEWRKWDLHIHTPLSICQQYGGDKEDVWEEFICSLENLPVEVKVIGITDYYFIDGYQKVMQYKQKGRLKNIEKIFPILEFRIDTFGSGSENKLQKINLHILFDVDENNLDNEIKNIQEEFIDNIKITSLEAHKTKKISKENFINIAGNLQDGFNSLIPSTKEVFDLISSKTWKHKTFLFLGYKEWGNLDKNNQLKPFKEDLYSKVNAFFSNNAYNNTNNQKWLNEFGNKKLLHSLDIHNFTDLDTYKFDENGNKKEIVNYHCFTWIKADPTFEGLKQIIYEPEERVKIQENKPEQKTDYQVIDRIEISHNDFIEKEGNNIKEKIIYLNSNLNTIIGGRSTGKSILLGAIAKKLHSDKEVKFDNTEYTQYISDIVSKTKIFWKDGSENNTRDIEYFPQSYMYRLAKNDTELNALVKDIITQDPDKKTKIDYYISFSSSNNTEVINNINRLLAIQREIDNINKSIKEKGDEEGIKNEKDKLEKELATLKSKIEITDADWAEYVRLKKNMDDNSALIKSLEEQKIVLSNLKTTSFINERIKDDFVKLEENIKEKVESTFDNIKQKYVKEWEESIQKILLEIDEKIATLKNKNEVIEEDSLYLKGKTTIESNKQYKEIQEKHKIESDKLTDIQNLNKQKQEQDRIFNNLKEDIINQSKNYYEKLNEILPDLNVETGKLKIKASINAKFSEYKDILYRSINQQSYQGQSIVSKEIKDVEKLFEDIKDIFNKLLHKAITLKGSYDNEKLIKELLGTNFFEISYEIEYETDKFKQMSEGKKAFVILLLLLDFSRKQCPILIDQPEDDLDNRAIYNELVTYIKNKKKERQIIIVTHNSNIVIGGDSELVIVSNQQGINSPNKQNQKFDYVFGSIESSKEKDNSITEILYSQGIRQHICEILEGGEQAFKNREKKYGFN